MEFTEVTAKSGSGQNRANDDVPQRVSDKTAENKRKSQASNFPKIKCGFSFDELLGLFSFKLFLHFASIKSLKIIIQLFLTFDFEKTLETL